MRGFSPIINILLTCVAAVALVPVLSLPWFAGAMDTNDGNQGQVELMGEAVARWFTQQGNVSNGVDVLTWAETALLGVVGLTVLLALAMLLPPLRASLRGLVKVLPIAAPLIVAAGIIAEASSATVEPRYGAFVALALTAFLASAAGQAGEMRERHTAPKPYEPGPGRAY